MEWTVAWISSEVKGERLSVFIVVEVGLASSVQSELPKVDERIRHSEQCSNEVFFRGARNEKQLYPTKDRETTLYRGAMIFQLRKAEGPTPAYNPVELVGFPTGDGGLQCNVAARRKGDDAAFSQLGKLPP